MDMKLNPLTNLKAGFKDDSLLLFCYTGGGEDDSFVFPTQCHCSLDILILRQHPPQVKGQLAHRCFKTQSDYEHIGWREALWENLPSMRIK